jgi:type II secretory ATPase GspE/PulE/Tfp pilus assembly ATPase PilB-like protein
VSSPDETGAVAVVAHLIAEAWRQRVSDIHLEPRSDRLRVRYRIDGMLTERRAVALGMAPAVLNRVKVLASLDIAERRLPQDGAFRHTVDDTEFALRVSSFPTEYGEKLVLRLLGDRRDVSALHELGMPPPMVDALRRIARRPSGMVVVAGPTGSGKTSTLYAVLREIEKTEVNIVTLENPIEYRFSGVVQGQTNARAGFTFAAGLRAILRQDPDVIMVGEMRDAETASIALKAALTGHMVLTSLHTNSVAETVVRLVDMGSERFVVAATLRAVLAQRLIRRLCPACRRAVPSDTAARALLGAQAPDHLFEPRGCPKCAGTGYLGRTGIFELAELDDGVAGMIKEGAGRVEIEGELGRRGVRGLREAGLAAAASGLTSLAEILRVVS